MRIALEPVQPPRPNVSMVFSLDEARTVVAALRDYAELYPTAVRREDWLAWAKDLAAILRSAT